LFPVWVAISFGALSIIIAAICIIIYILCICIRRIQARCNNNHEESTCTLDSNGGDAGTPSINNLLAMEQATCSTSSESESANYDHHATPTHSLALSNKKSSKPNKKKTMKRKKLPKKSQAEAQPKEMKKLVKDVSTTSATSTDSFEMPGIIETVISATSNSPTAPSLHQSIPPGNPINIGDKSAPVDDENEIAELMSTLNPMPTDWPVSGHDDQEQADYFGRNYHY
jgi:hypothetical protein